jgi:hypothetical protein
MNLPAPNRQHLHMHPFKVDYQRILDNAFALANEIFLQYQGYFPFGIGLNTSDELYFVGWNPGQLQIGLMEHVESQLRKQSKNLKALARCTHVKIQSRNITIGALQVNLEHRNGVALCAYQPMSGTDKWWVEEGRNRIFPQPVAES